MVHLAHLQHWQVPDASEESEKKAAVGSYGMSRAQRKFPPDLHYLEVSF